MISFRRYYLDQYLFEHTNLMFGKVLDIGGVKNSKRGNFMPPLEKVVEWKYLNTNPKTDPDYCCSALSIPLGDNLVNTVILTEVLEYISDPNRLFSEIYRVLDMDGYCIASVPFLNPLHGDYWVDRCRYTPVMLNDLAANNGFDVIKIESMGSVGAVIYDILRVVLGGYSNDGNRYLYGVLRWFQFLFAWMDRKTIKQSKFINTGYFFVFKKGNHEHK